ncbi:hypothetical protein T03_10052 [Trichinella britovi]|uniref:Uncharacterized protein n=1 Tax=Trichinella britovi TaxID=45882 RepID=A0A0V1ANC8_TRIBR|nr:hypothetical protein T03_10052 [Trichinella britovi]
MDYIINIQLVYTPASIYREYSRLALVFGHITQVW